LDMVCHPAVIEDPWLSEAGPVETFIVGAALSATSLGISCLSLAVYIF
jgi:hypothetical protein